MLKRIETFKRIKEQMVILGYLPFQNLPSWCENIPVHSTYIGIIFINLILFTCTTSWFFIFEEKTFDELAESVFYTVQASLYTVLYPSLLQINDPLLKIFEQLENIIEGSK